MPIVDVKASWVAGNTWCFQSTPREPPVAPAEGNPAFLNVFKFTYAFSEQLIMPENGPVKPKKCENGNHYFEWVIPQGDPCLDDDDRR